MRKLKKELYLFFSVALLLLVFIPRGHAASVDELWSEGNQLFSQQKYDQAIERYQQIEQSGKHSAALYYNMGNAYFRLGKMGPTILYYQRATFQDPENKEIRDNLLLAQSKIALPVTIGAPIFFISWWQRLLSGTSPNLWAFLMLLCFVAGLWLLFQRIKRKEKELTNDRLLALSIILFLVTGILFYNSDRIRTHNNQAVIMADNTPFFKNQETNEPSGNLPEGTSVRIQSEQPGWYSVVLPNGAVAWVTSANLDKVVGAND